MKFKEAKQVNEGLSSKYTLWVKKIVDGFMDNFGDEKYKNAKELRDVLDANIHHFDDRKYVDEFYYGNKEFRKTIEDTLIKKLNLK